MLIESILNHRFIMPSAMVDFSGFDKPNIFNAIIGAIALMSIVKVPYYISLLIVVAIMAVIGIYGIEVVHSFEKSMSIVLGILFLFLLIVSFEKINGQVMINYSKNASFSPYLVALVLASVFSYLAATPQRFY